MVSARPLALTHITLIDGTGRPPLEDAVLVLRHGRVEAVPTRRSGSRRMVSR